MNEATALKLMHMGAALNPQLSGFPSEWMQAQESLRESKDLRALQPIYHLLMTNPLEAYEQLGSIKPQSAKGAKVHTELVRAAREEYDSARRRAGVAAVLDPRVWRPVEGPPITRTYEGIPYQVPASEMPNVPEPPSYVAPDPRYSPSFDVFGASPAVPFTHQEPGPTRPVRPIDILERIPEHLREHALDALTKLWKLEHGADHVSDRERLSAVLEQKRNEILSRGLSPYEGEGLREFQRFYAIHNPTSELAQRLYSGDLHGAVPEYNVRAAQEYRKRLNRIWEGVSDEEKQLMLPQYESVLAAIDELELDPRARQSQTMTKLAEFTRQITAARKFNQQFGFRNEQFQESKRRYQIAQAMQREALDLRKEESQERSDERRLRIQKRRLDLEARARSEAMRAFAIMGQFLSNLRFMASDDPHVQSMRRIAQEMMSLYMSQFPSLANPPEPEDRIELR